MLNSKAFKKLAALTAAVALVGSFAVSASAIKVNTTTTYVAGSNEEKITVSVNVTEATPNSEVTYYAIDAGAATPYHVDQATVVSGTATFDSFVTDAAKLNAEVLVNGAADEITGRTVSYGGQVVKTIPNADTTSTTVTLENVIGALKALDAEASSADNAEALFVARDDDVIVTLSNITGDVVINLVLNDVQVDNSTGKYITAGYVNTNEGVKITVLGQVSGLKEGADFGAKIAGETFKSLIAAPTDGYFAIQVIGSDYVAGDYATGIYYTKADDSVVDVAGTTVTVQ